MQEEEEQQQQQQKGTKQDTVPSNIKYEEEFITRRGLKLFTCRWLPTTQDIKALVFLCHGYGGETSILMKGNFYFFFTN
jgi:hypothetical protein